MIEKKKIESIVLEKINGTIFFLVDIKIGKADKIDIYFDSPKGITIEDCVSLSRFVEERLSEEYVNFELNVSSPGIGTPYKVKEQYVKNIGRDVEVFLNDNEKIKGVLMEVTDTGIIIESEKKEKVEGKSKKQIIKQQINILFNNIKSTTSVVSFKQ